MDNEKNEMLNNLKSFNKALSDWIPDEGVHLGETCECNHLNLLREEKARLRQRCNQYERKLSGHKRTVNRLDVLTSVNAALLKRLQMKERPTLQKRKALNDKIRELGATVENAVLAEAHKRGEPEEKVFKDLSPEEFRKIIFNQGAELLASEKELDIERSEKKDLLADYNKLKLGFTQCNDLLNNVNMDHDKLKGMYRSLESNAIKNAKYATKLEKDTDMLNQELDCCRDNYISIGDKNKALEEESTAIKERLADVNDKLIEEKELCKSVHDKLLRKARIVKTIADFIEASIKDGQAELVVLVKKGGAPRAREICEGFISALMRIKVAVGIIARNDSEEIVANYKYASEDIHNALGI